MNEEDHIASAPISVLWLQCPACGGVAGFRPFDDGARVVGACFEDTSCWWVGDAATVATARAPRRRDHRATP